MYYPTIIQLKENNNGWDFERSEYNGRDREFNNP